MNPERISELKYSLCSGILFHMLGLDRYGYGKNELKTVNDYCANIPQFKEFNKLSEGVLEYKATKDRSQRSRALQIIIQSTRDILNLDKDILPGLKYEYDHNQPDSNHKRDVYTIKKEHIDDIALAIICYLLRGFASFFGLSRSKRDFFAAKRALNDINLAYQLALKLEFTSSKTTYHPQGNESARKIRYSHFFFWNIYRLCHILNGNIYRQIYSIEKADRHYGLAQIKFNGLWTYAKHRDFKNSRVLLTPTLIKAMFEQSKCQFDLGKFLEALTIQMRCLEFLIHLNLIDEPSHARPLILKKIQKIITLLEKEHRYPFFNPQRLTSLFCDPSAKHPDCPLFREEMDCFNPKELLKHIPPYMAFLVAEILSRIGFNLYIICQKKIAWQELMQQRKKKSEEEEREESKKENEEIEWLNSYFRFDKTWNERRGQDEQIRRSYFSYYWSTLLHDSTEKTDDAADFKFYSDEVESMFALKLRRSVGKDPFFDEELDENNFYRSILAETTKNIKNIVRIPRQNRGFLMRHHNQNEGEQSEEHRGRSSTRINQFVVLRRWQSFNPKIPRPRKRRVRGGGYFFRWQGKGIVIDPGFDFLQNFYEEGFSLDDIHAILITHSHPDHDDELTSIITLIKEWNEFHQKTGRSVNPKQLDLFLNKSAYRKFSSFMHAPNVELGRIIPLPVVTWDKNSIASGKGPIRGRNVHIDLRKQDFDPDQIDPYHMIIEIVPAWHDDILGKSAAVGIKFHLYNDECKDAIGIIGFTGDTGAYGLDITKRNQQPNILRVDNQYKDCDVLIAHIGDIRLRELASAIRSNSNQYPLPLTEFLRDLFRGLGQSSAEEFANRARDFLHFVITLNLVPAAALEAPIEDEKGQFHELSEWLGFYIEKEGNDSYGLFRGILTIKETFQKIDEAINYNEWAEQIELEIENAEEYIIAINNRHAYFAYILLEFLAISSIVSWQYPHHLGIFGLYKLFECMVNHWQMRLNEEPDLKKSNRIFVIGELPEELASYRDVIAARLNLTKVNTNRYIHAFTGDIGLDIKLDFQKIAGGVRAANPAESDSSVNHHGKCNLLSKIRCKCCSYNNNFVNNKNDYHPPEQIIEKSIERLQGAMIYLCKRRNHHLINPDILEQFF